MAAAPGVARSTLQGWCRDVPRRDPPAGLTAFARTPEGIAWLHRLVLAAQFSITLRAAGGTRLVSEFRSAAAPSALVARDAELTQALARQTQARELARELVRELGVLYHPYDLQQGQTPSVERVAGRLTAVWTRLKELAEAAALPERARERLAKAERLTVQWLATPAFFFATVTARVETLALSPEQETAVLEQLIPAVDLKRVAARSTTAKPRHRVQALSTALLDALQRPDHPLQRLAPEDRARVEQLAGACADLFQRSSSCVEGRNGQLSLHHHGRYRLSDRWLAALTGLHNFHIRRSDGRTAAERFFGRTHHALFEQLLVRVPLPPRPRRRRPRPPKLPDLMSVAA